MKRAGETPEGEVGRGSIEEAGRGVKGREERDASSDSGHQRTLGCRQYDAQGRGGMLMGSVKSWENKTGVVIKDDRENSTVTMTG